MNSLKKYISLFLVLSGVISCSAILETVDLSLDERDLSSQETFRVEEKTLTISEAQKQNKTVYNRFVIQNGPGNKAGNIPEFAALRSEFPKNNEPSPYLIGIGDTLKFSRLIDNKQKQPDSVLKWPPSGEVKQYKLGIGDELNLIQIVQEKNTTTNNLQPNELPSMFTEETQKVVSATSRIGSDGSVLFLEIGRLDAVGKTLNELRSEVRNIFIRNGSSPRFQLEITRFESQRAYLTINSRSSIIKLNDQKTDLKDVLSSAGKGLEPGGITTVRLQRNKVNYRMTLREIFNRDAPKIIIQDRDHIFVEDRSSELKITLSTVSEDGSIVLEGIGKLIAEGKKLSEIRNEIAFLMEKLPGLETAFQIEISQFLSQKALVNIPSKPGGNIILKNSALALDEVLTESGLAVTGEKIFRIKLQRGSKEYSFTLRALLDETTNRLYLEPNDRVRVEILSYKPSKVFILGGVSPTVVEINPAIRETLADILFTNGGVLSSSSAKRSEVYLLRGSNPVKAFHLDAKSPTRLIVADNMELRPNDILYVAEQPLVSFNRTLGSLLPLRVLLRDIQDNNIP